MVGGVRGVGAWVEERASRSKIEASKQLLLKFEFRNLILNLEAYKL
jgi:hypothetical protein